MNTIWKYILPLTAKQIVFMPRGARILTVQIQEGNICLWAIVDTDNGNEERRFAIVGTGAPNEIPTDSTYIGTCQDGAFVWHVFEYTETKTVN